LSKLPPNIECSQCVGKPKSVFCELEKIALEQLEHEKTVNTYKRGQALFYQGNPPFGLYCINNGKVKITKTGYDGKETIVRIASGGDLLGHRSLFSDSPYAASAIILEDANICFISKKTIYDLMQKEPSISFRIIMRLSAEMGRAENQLASMAQKSVRERFAELLLLLERSFGEKLSNRTEIKIKLSREEMASMIGTTPETLTRLVTEFKNDGLIEQNGKSLHLTDRAKVEEYAEFGF